MRKDPRVEQSRALVLQAATALFVEGGVRGVSVDAVSARSGVARTTIYRHWAGRDEILADVLRGFHWDLELPPDALDPAERLRLVVRQLAAALRDPTWRRALPAMLDAASRSDELAGVRDRLSASQRKVLRVVLEDAVDRGALPAGTDVGEAMLQIVGPLVMAALFPGDVLDEAFADRMVDLFLASRAPAAAPGLPGSATRAARAERGDRSRRR